MSDVRFGEYQTLYHGRRDRVLTVWIESEELRLKIGDTHRCARSIEDCRETLRTLARLVDVDPDAVARQAETMMMKARALTGWVAQPKRDRPRVRPTRITI